MSCRAALLALSLASLPATAAAAVPQSATASAASADALATVSERSGFQRTGRYEEVGRLAAAFQARHPDRVRALEFGTTPEGRPMQLLVVTATGVFDPAEARRRGLPVVLMQGGIHAGEIDGKDAGFLALRQVLAGQAAPGALDKVVWLFVPVFNVDGHERFGAWNRPNQRGPEQMGWRTTAQNFNLNRDYVKADAPEMRAMLRLVQAWDPLATVDLHATDGAQFEHDISIQVEPLHAGDARLREIGRAWRNAVIADLARQGSKPLPFYPSFVENDNPASGFEDGVPPPRFSHGYFLLRNRLGMLVETHSWKPYPERVRITRNTIVSVLEQMAAHGAQWRREADAADARAAKLGGQSEPLAWKAGAKARDVDFLGYAYTRTPSDVSGALMTRYDETTPQVWRVPLRDDVQPALHAVAPRAGYLVPPAWAAFVQPALEAHGVAFRRVDAAWPGAPVQAFRTTAPQFAGNSMEGRQRLSLEGAWKPEPRDVGAGALYVPIAQPLSRLVLALLEPQAPDSVAAWGALNVAFERKEYMEDYVAEDVARAMLADDPALGDEFRRRLADDPAFAADPGARLDFFYRRHPAWDERYGLYPVLRLDQPPPDR
ncbi:M14 family metallopeptidase [Pseudoxanthomonas koreensis]|uniref:M14 family metallopeptidase n=1 Tax=Pseudoxanthomonas koreensis TaxID=266061 RepID=UPI001391B317|nr:M14 family metallopeptidase [Pseudoxanthomonas koreensis]KAF1691232.1 peptidase M14 [Pseudoxanthomonas koreensis]